MYTEPKTIAIDFDQTICDSIYPALGPPKPGAREALQEFRDMGFRIIISSCRSCAWNWEDYYPGTEFVPADDRPVYMNMKTWLDEHKMPYDILDNGTKGKVSALHYIDDKGVRYDNNWPEVVSFVKEIETKKQLLLGSGE